MIRTTLFVAILALAAGTASAHHGATHPVTFAQGQPHQGHGTSVAASEPPSTRAYREAYATMHREMDVPLTGNADRDFVASMIAHHQGAIEMARIVLRYGQDAEVRRLAEEIVKAQEAEMVAMRAMLRRLGG